MYGLKSENQFMQVSHKFYEQYLLFYNTKGYIYN